MNRFQRGVLNVQDALFVLWINKYMSEMSNFKPQRLNEPLIDSIRGKIPMSKKLSLDFGI